MAPGPPGALAAFADRPEAALLLAAAAVTADDERSARIAELSRRVTDWEWLTRATIEAGLAQLVHRHLSRVSSAAPAASCIPTDVLERLRDVADASSFRNLALARTLVATVEILEAERIPSIALKGPTLARLAYPDLGMRPYTDLDVLVHPDHFAAARAALIARGFTPYRVYEPVAGTPATSFRDDYHEAWREPAGDGVVELHWGVSRRRFGFRFDAEWWMRDPQRVDIGGVPVHTLSLERLLIYLCLHAAKHVWLQLNWILDLAQLIRTHPELAWARLESQAREARAVRILALGLELAVQVAGAPVPSAVLAPERSSRPIRRLVERVTRDLFTARAVQGTLRMPEFYLQLHDSRLSRARHLVSLVTRPTAEDMELVLLPRALRPLYAVLRPARLAWKYSRAAVARRHTRHERSYLP